jgi:glycosyltransferase involved in cell wall biosynthesis
MTKIKLLQIAKFYDPDRGGIESVTRCISHMLSEEGIQADVLCTAMKSDYAEIEFPHQLYRHQSDFGFGNKKFSIDYFRDIGRLQSEYDVAIVHLPNPWAVAGVLAQWKKPLIVLWHAEITNPILRSVSIQLERAVVRKAHSVIGPTPRHFEGSHIADAFDGKGVPIFYPFDPTNLPTATGTSSAARRVQEFLKGRHMSLSVGRLVPYKGYDVLINSAKHFSPDVAAVIVGSGALHEQLSAQIKQAGVGDRVMLAGALEQDELADLLALTHVGCMPSINHAEMYGIAQVEAMAAGKPLVSTRVPRSGVAFINDHDRTGLTVEVGDEVALANALNLMSSDKALYERLSEGAKRSYAEQHALGPVTKQYADLIRAAVAGQKLPASQTWSFIDRTSAPSHIRPKDH